MFAETIRLLAAGGRVEDDANFHAWRLSDCVDRRRWGCDVLSAARETFNVQRSTLNVQVRTVTGAPYIARWPTNCKSNVEGPVGAFVLLRLPHLHVES